MAALYAVVYVASLLKVVASIPVIVVSDEMVFWLDSTALAGPAATTCVVCCELIAGFPVFVPVVANSLFRADGVESGEA